MEFIENYVNLGNSNLPPIIL